MSSMHSGKMPEIDRCAGKTSRLPGQDQYLQVLIVSRTHLQTPKSGSGAEERPTMICSSFWPPACGNIMGKNILHKERRLPCHNEELLWPLRLSVAPATLPSLAKKAPRPALVQIKESDGSSANGRHTDSALSAKRSTGKLGRLPVPAGPVGPQPPQD